MAIHEIRIISTDGDPRDEELSAEIKSTSGLEVEVGSEKVYRFEGISHREAYQLAGELTDPVSEASAIDLPFESHPYGLEVAYKPGVMNPEAGSLMKVAGDLGIQAKAADSSLEYFFQTDADAVAVQAAAAKLLVNKTVQHRVTEQPETLLFSGETGPVQVVPIRELSSDELIGLSKDKLFLDEEEMGVIQDYFRTQERDPKDAELETIAAYWSEHCGHKTFRAKILVEQADGTYIEKPSFISRIQSSAEHHPNFERLVVSAYDDNSGVMRFYEGVAICGKVETHNSPSAIEPYGGAMTGSGGVYRDIAGTGQGAKNIISTDMFCVAPPDMDSSKLPAGVLQPGYLLRNVIKGVGDYGNREGIPTANGSIHFHERFRAKPSVIVGAYGILPEKYAEKGRPEVGDLVVILGGRTGRDGIHGATFSSGDMTERTATVNSSAVQIGNPIEEKRTFDALLEARDADLIRALTDCGAAGFCSAIGEIGEETGVTVDISKAPLKYEGLAPWEIWVSESQERMVAAISPDNLEAFIKICEKHNVEATALGIFDGTHTLTVNYGEQNVIELDYEFLKNGLPQRTLIAKWQKPEMEELKPLTPQNGEEWLNRFQAVLAHGNVQSKEPVVRQYDHGVQGGNIVSPYGGVNQDAPNDALVIRPMLGKPYGVVQSHGMNPILIDLDPYEGTKWAIAEAAANYVAVGGDINEAVAAGNYISPSPDEETLGALDLEVSAVEEMTAAGLPPVITGKDSLSSTYRGSGEVIKIPPVYVKSIFGRIPDVEKTITSSIKKPGESWLYVVGPQSIEMGGSAYYDIAGGSSGEIPKVDSKILPEVLQKMHAAITKGQVLACHDISEGGLVTAVAEMCFGSGTGTEIHVPLDADAESFLFSETAGSFVVEVSGSKEMAEAFVGMPHRLLGKTKTTEDFVVVRGGYNPLFKTDIVSLKQAWQAPMKEFYHE